MYPFSSMTKICYQYVSLVLPKCPTICLFHSLWLLSILSLVFIVSFIGLLRSSLYYVYNLHSFQSRNYFNFITPIFITFWLNFLSEDILFFISSIFIASFLTEFLKWRVIIYIWTTPCILVAITIFYLLRSLAYFRFSLLQVITKEFQSEFFI